MMDMKVLRTNEGSETWNSDGTLKESEISYLVIGASSKTAAKDAILKDAPTENEGLFRSGIRFDGYGDGGEIEMTVIYENPDNESGGASSGTGSSSESDPPTAAFDCGGAPKRLNYSSKPPRKAYSAEGYSKDPGGAIGWNGKTGPECEIAGIEIPIGEMRETYTKVMSRGKLTVDFKRKVNRLVGKVNSTAWKGWEAGEVMFMGASYTAPLKGTTRVTVTFNFTVRENEKDAKVNGISCGSRKGFEAIWAVPSSKSANNLQKVDVDAVYISEVCESADFGILGLGK